MKNLILFFCFAFFLNTIGLSQKQQPVEGIYTGGICADEAICGTWLLQSDSTFIFLNFQGNYLKHIGQGKFSMRNDTLINFHFKENQLPILEKNVINYSSMTVKSFDSSYINGQIKNGQNNGIPFASIVINDQYAISSDSIGKFEIAIPRSKVIPNSLTFIKKMNGYNTINTLLNAANNYHELHVVMPIADSSSSFPVYDSNLSTGRLLSENGTLNLRVNRVNSKVRGYNSITLMNENKDDIIEMLNKAKEAQPYLSANIDQLIGFIN